MKDKRAEIHGRITAYQAQIAQAKQDLAQLNASIRLFTDICVRHLEVDGELTTRDLAERVMIERRLDATDATLRNSVVFKVVQGLRQCAEDVRSFVNPASLLTCLGEDIPQGRPEPKGAVACSQVRRDSQPATGTENRWFCSARAIGPSPLPLHLVCFRTILRKSATDGCDNGRKI